MAANSATRNPKPGTRILVSNDDGINAEGLVVLERIAKTLSKDVWVSAPEAEQSGAGHSLTLHLPVRVRKITPKRYAISGTPTDCVLLALHQIIPPPKGGRVAEGREGVKGKSHRTPSRLATLGTLPPLGGGKVVDLVLSGVNRGSNVGDDVTYSGTVAAAMEGAILGVPSIALSQLFDDPSRVQWKTAETFAPKLIKKLLAAGWPQGTFINLNFPNCPPAKVKGVKICAQGKRLVNVALSERVDPKGRPYYWIGGARKDKADRPDVDIEWLNKGYITVTPLCLDLTDHKTMGNLQQVV